MTATATPSRRKIGAAHFTIDFAWFTDHVRQLWAEHSFDKAVSLLTSTGIPREAAHDIIRGKKRMTQDPNGREGVDGRLAPDKWKPDPRRCAHGIYPDPDELPALASRGDAVPNERGVQVDERWFCAQPTGIGIRQMDGALGRRNDVRNISFMLTTRQVRNRTKDVTRRLKWLNLKVGERLQGCEKCQGRKAGEPLVRLCVVEVVSVRREPLRNMTDDPAYGNDEVEREGFPEMTPEAFVEFFCDSHAKCTPDTEVTRIEFKYV